MSSLLKAFWDGVQESPRLFFAPLIDAVSAGSGELKTHERKGRSPLGEAEDDGEALVGFHSLGALEKGYKVVIHASAMTDHVVSTSVGRYIVRGVRHPVPLVYLGLGREPLMIGNSHDSNDHDSASSKAAG